VHDGRVAADAFINCRVTSQTRARLRHMAQLEGINESAFIKQLLSVALRESNALKEPFPPVARLPTRQQRVCVRLSAQDWRLLQERAAARSVAPSTYVALLARSHLTGAPPLPKAEYLALRQSVLELTTIGRNLNQILRVVHHSGNAALPGRGEVASMLKVAEALRDHFKDLLKANESSWSLGAKTPR
jgi:hypothetical protein